jgi:hypothetical protein
MVGAGLDHQAHVAVSGGLVQGLRFFQAAGAVGADLETRRALTAACFAEADQAEVDWLKRVDGLASAVGVRFYYRSAWRGWNRAAHLPE